MTLKSSVQRFGHIALTVLACLLVVLILWLDIATEIWDNLVIISGLAAGIVSFIFTALVLNRIVVHNAAKRWSSVNRLAFSEFLHTLADEDRSEIARGEIIARSLKLPAQLATTHVSGGQAPLDALQALREQIVVERDVLSKVLSRWAQFLASSGDNEPVLLHFAKIAWQFDVVRDLALDAERSWTEERKTAILIEVADTNRHLESLVHELQTRLRRLP